MCYWLDYDTVKHQQILTFKNIVFNYCIYCTPK